MYTRKRGVQFCTIFPWHIILYENKNNCLNCSHLPFLWPILRTVGAKLLKKPFDEVGIFRPCLTCRWRGKLALRKRQQIYIAYGYLIYPSVPTTLFSTEFSFAFVGHLHERCDCGEGGGGERVPTSHPALVCLPECLPSKLII